jgi:hypothetical protein
MMRIRQGKLLALLLLALIAALIRSTDVTRVGATATQSDGRRHWAFAPPIKSALPPVNNAGWVRNSIDNFVLARLEAQGLAPSPEATRTELIRRLSLDMTGLPPTLKEIDQYLNDESPDAYEKLVERMLASPHYGERWGRHWLDVARYADTNGYEKDQARSIWPYRDWVIRAFNDDKPFDQFTIEQLAGDLLPVPTLEQRIATGFLRNSMRNEEGSVQPEQFRVEGLIDRVDAIGKAFLGLTIACAQCHTHKYDPIGHQEYYKFYAFLNSDEEPYLEVTSEDLAAKRAEIEGRIARIEDEWIAKDSGLMKRYADWESRARLYQDKWRVLPITDFFSSRAKIEERLDDGSVRVESYRYPEAAFFVKSKTDLKNITGVRLELLTDPCLRRNGPGVSETGALVLTDFALEASPAGGSNAAPGNEAAPQKILFTKAEADFERADAPLALALDADPKSGWSSDAGPVRRNQDRKLVFTAKTPFGFEGGTNLAFTIAHMAGGVQITGRFRLSVTTEPVPPFDPLPAGVRRILSIPTAERTKAQQREARSHFISVDPQSAAAREAIDEAIKNWPYGVTTMTLAARSTPRATYLFKRGDWRKPDVAVTPDTPAFLHPFPKDAPRNRLGLARWITAKDNPLTARVIVNRVWQQYFGQGLAPTPEDFGTRCETPSHPELMDWLAIEFRDQGWSLKKLHRLIVNSATYRQSSKVTPRLLEKDPTNRWLARAPRLRVEAEVVRDQALAAAGLLSRKIGGPPVFSPIPAGVLDMGFGGAMAWTEARGEDRYRRAMYTFWKRTVPYPSLSTFDAPNADVSCPRRVRSNTPLQALTTLNDKLFMEAAQGLALRAWKEGGGDDRSKLSYAFRLCAGRRPDQFEEKELLELLQTEYRNFDGQTALAVYVSAADLENLPAGVDLHKVAAWTIVARVLLNLDEVITRK